jgi:hypothetical protein
MPGKNARQCRERWINYLKPDLNTEGWTHEDDFLLVQKCAELGRKWVQIAAFFPNRTDSMVKNRFNKLYRRERKQYELLMNASHAQSLKCKQPVFTRGQNRQSHSVSARVVEAMKPTVVDIESDSWPDSLSLADDDWLELERQDCI